MAALMGLRRAGTLCGSAEWVVFTFVEYWVERIIEQECVCCCQQRNQRCVESKRDEAQWQSVNTRLYVCLTFQAREYPRMTYFLLLLHIALRLFQPGIGFPYNWCSFLSIQCFRSSSFHTKSVWHTRMDIWTITYFKTGCNIVSWVQYQKD